MNQHRSGEKSPFPALKMNIKPMLTLLFAAAALLVLLLVLVPSGTAPQETEGQAVSQDATKAEKDCVITQTFRYERCGHEVTRRQTAPSEVAGKTMTQTQPMYEEWTITEFSPKSIVMTRTLPMYCADHLVLMPDETGMLCVFRNEYGDAMGLVRELNTALDQLPAAMQEEALLGIGFSSLGELEGWLESAES